MEDRGWQPPVRNPRIAPPVPIFFLIAGTRWNQVERWNTPGQIPTFRSGSFKLRVWSSAFQAVVKYRLRERATLNLKPETLNFPPALSIFF